MPEDPKSFETRLLTSNLLALTTAFASRLLPRILQLGRLERLCLWEMEECMEAAVSKTSPGEVTRGLEARV